MSDRYAERDMENYNISASQVKTHSKCPKQYWYRYIEGKKNTKKDSEYLTLGSRVHEAIEDVLSRDDPPELERNRLKSEFHRAYRNKRGLYLSDEFYADGQKCIEAAADFIADEEPDICGVEDRVEFELSRPDMSSGVTAIMDICTENEVWDWKTGRIRDETEHEEKIQGSIYMAGYYQEYNREPEAIRFVYLKEDEDRVVKPTDDNWNYMLSRAKALLHAKKTGEFDANPGEDCYWCGYEFWCGDSPVGMGNVDWEDY